MANLSLRPIPPTFNLILAGNSFLEQNVKFIFCVTSQRYNQSRVAYISDYENNTISLQCSLTITMDAVQSIHSFIRIMMIIHLEVENTQANQNKKKTKSSASRPSREPQEKKKKKHHPSNREKYRKKFKKANFKIFVIFHFSLSRNFQSFRRVHSERFAYSIHHSKPSI
jgi:thymidylate kinase